MLLHRKWATAVAATLLFFALFLSPAHAQSAGTLGWYNGDRQLGIPGFSNWYASNTQSMRVYDDFVVPAGGWTVLAVFSNNTLYDAPAVTQACWEIRSGVAAGTPGILVATGIGAATQTYSPNLNTYRIQVNGLQVALAAGRYWLSVAPMGPVGGQS